MRDRQDAVDHIVVGTGAGGSALVERLSRSGVATVLVLESGGHDLDPRLRIPKGFFLLLGRQQHSFLYDTLPTGPSLTPDHWQRGRVVGGSTSINGMQYERGERGYWQRLADDVGPEWARPEMLRVFRGIERHELGGSRQRGGAGPLDISVRRRRPPLDDALLDAAEAWGMQRVDDLNAHEGDRVSMTPTTIRHGVRRSAARAFLAPAVRRPNVTLLRHAHVERVLFDGTRAIGVRARIAGVQRDLLARKEVIVAAGTIETPLLLERSGVGGEEAVAKAGARLVVESPHVGEHVIEQRAISYQASIRRDIGDGRRLSSALRQLAAGAEYLVRRDGVLASGAYDIAALVRTRASLAEPDAMLLANPFALDLSARRLAVSRTPGFSAMGYLRSPVTESTVHASGPDPHAPPRITSRHLEHDVERRAAVRILEILREIAATDPLAALVVEEQSPGSRVSSEADVVAHAWAAGGHLLHAVGSARMGTAETGVLDASLRVRGVEGLRVADASALPAQPGNTMAPTLALGVRAAELIEAET